MHLTSDVRLCGILVARDNCANQSTIMVLLIAIAMTVTHFTRHTTVRRNAPPRSRIRYSRLNTHESACRVHVESAER
jgi:hypothetical protein